MAGDKAHLPWTRCNSRGRPPRATKGPCKQAHMLTNCIGPPQASHSAYIAACYCIEPKDEPARTSQAQSSIGNRLQALRICCCSNNSYTRPSRCGSAGPAGLQAPGGPRYLWPARTAPCSQHFPQCMNQIMMQMCHEKACHTEAVRPLVDLQRVAAAES